MGTPRASASAGSRGEQTAARILDVALPLFAERGYAGTSVRRIARAAEVNVATLAYHFSDKRGLYDAVVQRLHEDLVAVSLDDLGVDDPSRLLRAVVDRLWRFAVSHRVHIRLLLRHVLDAGTHPEVVSDLWVDRLLDRARPLLAALRPDWSEAERRLLVFSAVHLVVRFVLEDPEQLRRMLQVEGDLDEALVDWLTELLGARLALTG